MGCHRADYGSYGYARAAITVSMSRCLDHRQGLDPQPGYRFDKEYLPQKISQPELKAIPLTSPGATRSLHASVLLGRAQEREVEGVWQLRRRLRHNEIKSCHQFVGGQYWQKLRLCSEHLRSKRDHPGLQRRRRTRLRRPKFREPSQLGRWVYSTRAGFLGEPELPHLPYHLLDLQLIRRGRCSRPEALSSA